MSTVTVTAIQSSPSKDIAAVMSVPKATGQPAGGSPSAGSALIRRVRVPAQWGAIFQLHQPPVRTRCRLADAKLACDFSMRGQAVQPPSGVPPLAALAVCAVRPGGRSAAGGAGLRRPQALPRSRRVVAARGASRTLTERRGSGATASIQRWAEGLARDRGRKTKSKTLSFAGTIPHGFISPPMA